jgi:hypothetical protein
MKNDFIEKKIFFTINPCDLSNPNCVDLSNKTNLLKFKKDFSDTNWLYFFYTTNEFYPQNTQKPVQSKIENYY